jgi:Domain of unknown function (DUF397)
MEDQIGGRWRKSSYSGNGGNCVEVGEVQRGVLVRDTKQDGTRPVLRFSPAAWRRFADRVKGSLATDLRGTGGLIRGTFRPAAAARRTDHPGRAASGRGLNGARPRLFGQLKVVAVARYGMARGVAAPTMQRCGWTFLRRFERRPGGTVQLACSSASYPAQFATASPGVSV